MKNPWIFLLALAFAGAAHAQNFKWVDKDGKTRYGDTPPAGVKATALKGPASGPAPAPQAAASKDGKDAKEGNKGPLTSAEKDLEFRKRQEASKKEQEKVEQERQAKLDKAEDCTRTRENLAALQSGQRIARNNAAGERYFLDEAQTAQEIGKVQQTLKQYCS